MTAQELARQADIHPMTLSHLESGNSRVRPSTAEKLEKALRWQPGACAKIMADPTADEKTYADDPPAPTDVVVELARMMLNLGRQLRDDPSHDPQVLSAITERLVAIEDRLMKVLKYDFTHEVFAVLMDIDRFLNRQPDAAED